MKARVISGVIITIVTVGLGWTGGPVLGILLAVSSLLGYYEMTRALQVHGPYEAPAGGVNPAGGMDRKVNALEVVGLCATAAYWILLLLLSGTEVGFTDGTLAGPSYDNLGITVFVSDGNELTLLFLVGVFLVDMSIYVLTFPRYKAKQVIGAVFAFLYIPVMIGCIYRSRFLPGGKFVYALIFFCSWICDTGAWFFGRMLGRHKMAPVLSPHKTIEGAIGGIASGTLLCFLASLLAEAADPALQLKFASIVLGICGCLLGMVGDLGASAIKRDHNLKDYGNAIPGHGGIMDRFDSVIFTAPVIYYLGVLFLTVLL